MTVEATHEFLRIAGQQGLLSTDTVRGLAEEVHLRQLEPATLVLQRGLLSPVQVEIVETLRQPMEAVPGYEILSVLGHGGMGIVYRAKQLALNRVVALKTILVSQAANPSMLARFEQEAQTVAKLLHPHIITAYDFGRHQGRLFFAMEYVEGEDADHYAKRLHPLNERVAWNMVRQAASGLAHAAELGIVHRDIKPANLLLVSPPKGYPLPPGMTMVKIADFGLAFLTTEAGERTRLTSEQTTLGSPHYMAPEQIDAGKPVDLRADIYSLGATAYHLLAGHPPFEGKTLPQIIAQKLSDRKPAVLDVRSDVSAESVALMDAMLAKDPAQRIGNYTELLARIDALPVMGSDLPTQAWSSATAATIHAAVQPAHRRRRIGAGLAVLAALVVGVIAYALGVDPGSHSTNSPVASTSLTPTGWAVPLFDGKSLRGWQVQSGSWTPDQDDEGGSVISGTDGALMRPLLKASDGRATPISNYRLIVTVRLHEATAVELQFGVNLSNARHALRLTSDRVALGNRSADRAPFQPLADATPFEIGADRLHELKLEREATEWRAFVDETPVGTIPLSPQRELPEFRLAAEGGPGWFADVAVEELAAPSVPDQRP